MKRAFALISIVVCSLCALAQESPIRLWKGTKVRRAKSVTLTPYLPSGTPSAAIIVCPGGSYCWHDTPNEGTAVARWLQSNGIAAFVLNYRVQGVFPYIFHTRAIFGGHQHPDMMEDVQRGIQLVREQASAYRISPDRVGVMGFSAGGHLSMSSAAYSSTDFLAPLGIRHTVSLRPDFVAPIYPVVSMSHRDTHKRSRRALLGEYKQFRHSLRDSLSLEKHVPADCPPVFLVNCVDDPIVRYHNSEMLDSALTQKGVPHLYLQYQTGGHGFGAVPTKGTEESRQWMPAFLKWLSGLKL